MVITTQRISRLWSFEPSQRAEINLIIAILFLASCSVLINISQKSKHYWPWLDRQCQILHRQKEGVPEHNSLGGSSTQFFSFYSYAGRIQGPKFPRTNNSRECSLVDTLVKWLFLLKGKQTNKAQYAIIYSVLISWWILSTQVIALSIIY